VDNIPEKSVNGLRQFATQPSRGKLTQKSKIWRLGSLQKRRRKSESKYPGSKPVQGEYPIRLPKQTKNKKPRGSRGRKSRKPREELRKGGGGKPQTVFDDQALTGQR